MRNGSNYRFLTFGSVVMSILVLASVGLLATHQTFASNASNPQSNAITAAAEEVGPAVARVEVTKTVEAPASSIYEDPFFRYFFGEPPEREREVEALGSGFVIQWGEEKYVLTNEHVVSEADQIRLVFPDHQTFKAEIVGSDPLLDVAVLEITSGMYDATVEALPTVGLGSSSQARVGEWVVAIGNPEGFQNTVTAGVLSAKNRAIPKPNGEGSYIDLLQTDAAVNPGNSGGPLVNTKGEVIGINTLIVRRNRQGIPLTGLNFAVSIDSVKRILPDLIEKGKVTRAELGVLIQNLTAEISAKFGVSPGEGVLVADVDEDSPAEKAGIKPGDIILAVDGEEVENISQLQEEIMYKAVGATVDISLLRGEKELTLQATLVEKSDQESEDEPSKEITSERYGFTLRENTARIKEELQLVTDNGLIVTDVQSGGRAAAGGLRRGDVILSVERQRVDTVEEFNQIIESVSEDERLLLQVLRNDRPIFVTI